MIWFGGLAQKTKQFRESSKPGSMSGFSRRSRIGSMINSLNSDAKNLSRCWAFLAVRCVVYKD